MCGFVVDACDQVDGGIYASDGQWGQAALSEASMLPIAGSFLGIRRLAKLSEMQDVARNMVAAARMAGLAKKGSNLAAISLETDRVSIAAVAAAGQRTKHGLVASVGSANNPQRFISRTTGGDNPRLFDSEFKLLNYAANALGPPSDVAGTLRLHSELPVCRSCSSVISDFQRAYPNIRVSVTEG